MPSAIGTHDFQDPYDARIQFEDGVPDHTDVEPQEVEDQAEGDDGNDVNHVPSFEEPDAEVMPERRSARIATRQTGFMSVKESVEKLGDVAEDAIKQMLDMGVFEPVRGGKD